MFFYRKKVVEAKSKENLLSHSVCPICGKQLCHDWLMPIRYSPMVLLRLLILAGALAVLLCFLMLKFEDTAYFAYFSQLVYSAQPKTIIITLAITCLPAAFFVILGELKLAHFTEDDRYLYGLYCKTCGNGFVGLVDYKQTGECSEYSEDSTELKPERLANGEMLEG